MTAKKPKELSEAQWEVLARAFEREPEQYGQYQNGEVMTSYVLPRTLDILKEKGLIEEDWKVRTISERAKMHKSLLEQVESAQKILEDSGNWKKAYRALRRADFLDGRLLERSLWITEKARALCAEYFAPTP